MIYIIRHGKTEMNRTNLLQGRSNQPLNEEGIRQAREAASFFRDIEFSHVYSSPLIRAIQTAEIIAPGTRIITDDRLIEMDYGPYEGADLNNLPPEVLKFFSDFINNPEPQGMEKLKDVTYRMGSFLEEIRTLEGNILISTHAIAMKGALEYLDREFRGSYWSKFIGNCAIYYSDNSNGVLRSPEEVFNENKKERK